MKYQVILQMAAKINSPEFKKVVIENKNSPKVIDDRLVFYNKAEEIFVFNRGEWIYWKKIT